MGAIEAALTTTPRYRTAGCHGTGRRSCSAFFTATNGWSISTSSVPASAPIAPFSVTVSGRCDRSAILTAAVPPTGPPQQMATWSKSFFAGRGPHARPVGVPLPLGRACSHVRARVRRW
jgi:hypothetical protein